MPFMICQLSSMRKSMERVCFYTYILQMRKDSKIPDNMYTYSLINYYGSEP